MIRGTRRYNAVQLTEAIEDLGGSLDASGDVEYGEVIWKFKPGVASHARAFLFHPTQLLEDLPDEHKTCVYRVVQEALHNCARHSQASTVRIRVQQKPGTITLLIQDDGHGFDIKKSKGLGLLGTSALLVQLPQLGARAAGGIADLL